MSDEQLPSAPHEKARATGLRAIRHVVPTRRLEVGLVCATSLLSFALTVAISAAGGRDLGKAAITGAVIAAYAAPILCIWPVTLLISAVTTARVVTLSVNEDSIFVDGERFPIDQLAGLQIAPTPSGALLFLTRPHDVSSLALELDGPRTARLPKLPNFGVTRFLVDREPSLTLVRVAIGGCVALAFGAFGEWALLLLFFVGWFVVPMLWVLMVLDYSRSRLTVGNGAVTVDGNTVFAARQSSATLNGHVLTLATQDESFPRRAPVRLRWPYWRSDIRIVKASVDAAMVGCTGHSPFRE